MSEMLEGYRIGGTAGAAGWSKVHDDRLLWPRPLHPRSREGQATWWSGLEQKMVDLHARYERVCVED